MYIEQISVYLQHKPGSGAAVTKVLGEHGVNIRAMSLADVTRYGILHLIVDDPEKGFKVLKEAHFTLSSNDVLAVQLGDAPGELSHVLEILGEGGYNVDYAYAFITRKEDAAVVIIRVDDVGGGSVELLKKAGIKLLTRSEVYSM